MPRSSSGADGAFGFVGEKVDSETDRLHLWERQYAPRLGRFLHATAEGNAVVHTVSRHGPDVGEV